MFSSKKMQKYVFKYFSNKIVGSTHNQSRAHARSIRITKLEKNKLELVNTEENKKFDIIKYYSDVNTFSGDVNSTSRLNSLNESNLVNYKSGQIRILNTQEKNLNKTFSLSSPSHKFHTENKKDNKTLIFDIHKDKLKIEKTNTHLETLAEIKSDLYSIVKIVRMFSLYFVVPYNAFITLSYFDSSSLDALISQSFSSLALVFIPYLFTENFVINMKYDRKKDQVHITKMNFFCKLVTKVYDVRNLVRIHRKYNLRFFSYFRDRNTNEYFSIMKICTIKNPELFNQILPDKVLKGKRKEDINQRLIDTKLNKSEYILSFVKFYLFAYLFFTVGYVYYQAQNYKKKNEMELP
jgi:hypothetical protein